MRRLAAIVLIVVSASRGQAPDVAFRHLYTFGSKEGIHPPTILNRKGARFAMGNGDHPFGLVSPVAVTTDLRNQVWITDDGTNSVHVFDPEKRAYREIRRLPGIVLQQPSGITSDAQGRVFVADAGTGQILVFDEKGEYDHPLFKRDRPLEHPGAIALSEDGKSIYVADPPRNTVVELNREGEVNASIALPLELNAPSALAVVNNQIYVLGGPRRLVGVFSPGGRQRGELHWDGVDLPLAFAFDPLRRQFLVANPRWMVVQVFDEDGTCIGNFGQLGDRVDQMQRVDGLHVDSKGQVYVVDSRHGKVLVFGDER